MGAIGRQLTTVDVPLPAPWHAWPRRPRGAVDPELGRWAPSASALVVNLAHHKVDGTDWQYSEFADYDLVQAVVHMTIQVTSMGLICRQFRAFDLDKLTDDLHVPEDG